VSFTGMNQDTVANLYDFPAREYGTQGRWPSPDPAGLSSVHLRDPQTLNRYAYVNNNPLAFTDPLGLGVDADGNCIPDDYTACVSATPDQFEVCYIACGTEPGPAMGISDELTPPPQSQAPKQPLLVCAAETANKWSIANAIGTNGKTGFWNSAANGLFGNTISTVVSFAYGGSSTEFGTTAYDFGTKATEGSIDAVTGAAPVTDLGLGAESAAQISEGLATEGIGGIVTAGKLIYDIGSFGYAAYTCR
ncbi:MAG: RHS repeat-associated core domain-containing protein, partial [Candidatus Acidiferrales bacterium]